MGKIEEILKKRGILVLFYSDYFTPLSLICLKYLQKARSGDKGLYFVQGRAAMPTHLLKVLDQLSEKFTENIMVVPLSDPLHQFIIVNMLESFVDCYDWVFFDNFFTNLLVVRGLAKSLRTLIIAFEQISKIKQVSKKHNALFVIATVEEIRSIVPLDRVKAFADAVVRVERYEGEVRATVEKWENDN